MRDALKAIAELAVFLLFFAAIPLAWSLGWYQGYQHGTKYGFRQGLEQSMRDINGKK